MSQRPISRSPDLQKLQNEGYDISIRAGKLVVRHVPFRNAQNAVAYGTLVFDLTLVGDVAAAPGEHVGRFIGGIPHGTDGQKMTALINSESREEVMPGAFSVCSFSQKPVENGGMRSYRNYYEQVTTYVGLISAPAIALDNSATALHHPIVRDDEAEPSVFRYSDTASSRAGITALAEKLKSPKIAIVGLGGTGSYILDMIAKSPVSEIHLYDRDIFYQHNALRAPGAASEEDLQRKLPKVQRFAEIYEPLRHGVIPHACNITEENVDELREMSFVFVAADSGTAKRFIAEKLVEFGVPFIDVGMGLRLEENGIAGSLRATTVTKEKSDHLGRRLSVGVEADADDLYSQNIQVVELNALNAALAVIEWKQRLGFYVDDEHEHNAVYSIGGNCVIRDEAA